MPAMNMIFNWNREILESSRAPKGLLDGVEAAMSLTA
jgi:hypothetical protein